MKVNRPGWIFVCDGCEKRVEVAEDRDQPAGWWWTRSHDASRAKRDFDFCPDCAGEEGERAEQAIDTYWRRMEAWSAHLQRNIGLLGSGPQGFVLAEHDDV